MYTIQYILYIIQSILYVIQYILYNIQYLLYIIQCTLYNLQYSLYILYSCHVLTSPPNDLANSRATTASRHGAATECEIGAANSDVSNDAQMELVPRLIVDDLQISSGYQVWEERYGTMLCAFVSG